MIFPGVLVTAGAQTAQEAGYKNVSHLRQSGKRMITPAHEAEMEVYVGKPYVTECLRRGNTAYYKRARGRLPNEIECPL